MKGFLKNWARRRRRSTGASARFFRRISVVRNVERSYADWHRFAGSAKRCPAVFRFRDPKWATVSTDDQTRDQATAA